MAKHEKSGRYSYIEKGKNKIKKDFQKEQIKKTRGIMEKCRKQQRYEQLLECSFSPRKKKREYGQKWL